LQVTSADGPVRQADSIAGFILQSGTKKWASVEKMNLMLVQRRRFPLPDLFEQFAGPALSHLVAVEVILGRFYLGVLQIKKILGKLYILSSFLIPVNFS
jgi:hypothetical protein